MPRQRSLTPPVVLLVALASGAAACSGSGPAGGTAASPAPVPPGPTPTASAAPLAGGVGGTPATSAVPAATSGPTAGAHQPGHYFVMLGGARSGAGTYSGVSTIYCTSVDGAGSKLWTVAMIDPVGQVTEIDLQQNPSGWTGVTVGTSQDGEVGPWTARSDQPEQSAAIQVIPIGDVVQIAAQGVFHDAAKHEFTIDAAVDCSSVNAGGGGTD